MSWFWMLVSFGVAALAVAVVWQLLVSSDPGRAGRWTRPLIAAAIGLVILLEGALMLFKVPAFTEGARFTAAAHGLALVFAGAGIWGIAHRSRWYRLQQGKPIPPVDLPD